MRVCMLCGQCVCACVRACVRAFVRACVRVVTECVLPVCHWLLATTVKSHDFRCGTCPLR